MVFVRYAVNLKDWKLTMPRAHDGISNGIIALSVSGYIGVNFGQTLNCAFAVAIAMPDYLRMELQMHKCVYFDTEDNSKELFDRAKQRNQKDLSRVGFKKQITAIAAITEDGETWFSKGASAPEKFIAWLGKFEQITVYALNIQYDLGNLFGDAIDQLDIVMVGSRMIKARWRHCLFLDVYNIWPMSVAKLGKAFKLEKKRFDSHSKEYVFRDVEIIRKAMLYAKRFAINNGVEHIPNTLGGLCVSLWKADKGVNWHDSTVDSDGIARALYGGRVELFSCGGSGLSSYTDVNSLYPFCMLQPFPIANLPLKSLDGFGVARVRISVADAWLAPLPKRRKDGSIFYPIGTFSGWWTFAELRHAEQHGAKIIKLYEAWGSKHGEKYYSRFVEKFYKLRLQAKTDAERLMLKLCMNNLYGQLAVSGTITRSLLVTEQELKMQELFGLPVNNKYGVKKLANHKIPLPEHTNYMHAAHVTSYARIELFKYLAMIDAKRLIYCDTDSAIFFGKPPFPISDKLGAMKLEGTADEVRTFAPKTYQFGDTTKAKGVRQSLAEKFVEEGEVSYEQPFKFREAVTMFDRGNLKKLSVWHPVTKHLLTRYNKKQIRGNQYFPLHYNRSVA